MYIKCTNLYIECFVAHVQSLQCTDGYIHFMKCTDIVETCTYIDMSFWMLLFDSPGWLAACRLGLAAAWCHSYSSSSLIGISLRPCQKPFYHPSRPPLSALALGRRAGGRRRLFPAWCGSALPSGGVAGVAASAAAAAAAGEA